ncbi:hypothetical protein FH972_023282 [Carpinus fangiana]|uniref:Uncharacterized protein n=1 Tax=Carpinus fangiana TaxID=176857 RepID=A0A5N6KV57_9ROSI|nr:hypothetical protein FH972_023282 [Carpinus fangiana]
MAIGRPEEEVGDDWASLFHRSISDSSTIESPTEFWSSFDSRPGGEVPWALIYSRHDCNLARSKASRQSQSCTPFLTGIW